MKNLFLLLITCSCLSAVSGQTSKNKPAQKAPKLSTTWGGYPKGNVNTAQFKKIVDSAIVVKDEKGSFYPLTRFRINYIFLSTYKDSESLQVSTIKDLRVSDFYDTPMLSEPWRSSIIDNAKKGDTILINNVIVRMKNGKKTLAPDLKIALQ